MENLISVKNESKIFKSGDSEVRANDNISFNIRKGELTVILGSSGAGKTTLLNILGGMDSLSEGTVIVNGQDISKFNKKQLTTYRREEIGFVFQFYNLIQNLTILENVQLASEISKNALDPQKTLTNVGLGKMTSQFPAQLSGGEQQRASIARAIAKNPSLLLADEPTGALDYQTGKKILKLFQNFVHETEKNVIIVTHNSMIKTMADHVIEIKDGQVKNDTINKNPEPVENLEW
ncbi:ABC transporter ATP-binding protein [Pediococcus pentosaceus]|uniref:ABC transporter ATP-binding protein n=1 Tax=Pediococcus pentosaceus TaxID=1255 RepID=UPI0013233977|nr:ABC transporter ATP-binding protein [Pediococcus pentosaceus]KAF0521482.1 ATP-binding cassette domain-containing protein [Pediococcus pentosaceus]MBF7138783.1 ABC transporter ATP-binding protein [Pediococcus pentosaceus]